MKKFKCIRGSEAPESYITDCIENDNLVYDAEYRGNLETCLGWFRHNPDIYTFLLDEELGKVVGYINAMPITKELHLDIINGNYSDVEISTEHILHFKPGESHILYFCSIGIYPEYKNTRAFTTIYDGFIDSLNNFLDEDIKVDLLVADGVTEKGSRLCRLSGLELIRESKYGDGLYGLTDPFRKFKPLSSKAEEFKMQATLLE